MLLAVSPVPYTVLYLAKTVGAPECNAHMHCITDCLENELCLWDALLLKRRGVLQQLNTVGFIIMCFASGFSNLVLGCGLYPHLSTTLWAPQLSNWPVSDFDGNHGPPNGDKRTAKQLAVPRATVPQGCHGSKRAGAGPAPARISGGDSACASAEDPDKVEVLPDRLADGVSGAD